MKINVGIVNITLFFLIIYLTAGALWLFVVWNFVATCLFAAKVNKIDTFLMPRFRVLWVTVESVQTKISKIETKIGKLTPVIDLRERMNERKE